MSGEALQHDRFDRLQIRRSKLITSYSPALTWSFSERSFSSLIHSLDSPTNTTVDKAMQRCPAAPNAAPTRELSVCS